MMLGTRRTMVGVGATAAVWVLSMMLVSGQTTPAQGPLMAEQAFKNVQVLKGTTVEEFMGTMGIFSAALGMSCGDCHAGDDSKWENYAEDNPRKQMARVMVTMMANINRTNFRGRQVVTCYTCHRGSDRPKVTPSLAALYSPPPLEDPSDVIEQAQGAPPADEVLDKYIQAVGGTQRLAGLSSFVAKGFAVGYGPEEEKRPVEIFARASGQLTRIIHTSSGDNTTTFDGRAGWISAPFRPVAVLALTGHELDGVKLDADLAFPARIKQALTKWRVGRLFAIGDRDVQVVQGTSTGGALATLFFDAESGLLLRQVRYADSPVGRLPTQIDYEDYREVAGVKMPFKWTMTWLDGRETFELSEVQPNVPIDAARFGRPGPPVARAR
jgi:photosynthetic reaction center cytochrome c subunit